MMRILGLVLGALAAAAMLAAPGAVPEPVAHPNALWDVVHGLCATDKRLIGGPAPCMSVNRKDGWAVVPDLGRRTQVLLVPTQRIPGIESPVLLEDGKPNYWQAAWDARRYFERRVGRSVPREDVALAINSVVSRSQSQLHIHVDCVRADVRAALEARQDDIGAAWTRIRLPPFGLPYRVRRLEGADLAPRNPFALLARGVPEAGDDMGHFALAVVATTFSDGAPGFFLLADDSPRAFGEGLLDHGCAVLREP
jgi:CDP-diacylglycerol pyrophosphatase